MATERFEQVPVASAGELHRWLEANQARGESVWPVTWKKVQSGARPP